MNLRFGDEVTQDLRDIPEKGEDRILEEPVIQPEKVNSYQTPERSIKT